MSAILNQNVLWFEGIISVTQKTPKAKPWPPGMSKPLKAGPTAMQKMLSQNLRKVVTYENKPRPEAKGRS